MACRCLVRQNACRVVDAGLSESARGGELGLPGPVAMTMMTAGDVLWSGGHEGCWQSLARRKRR